MIEECLEYIEITSLGTLWEHFWNTSEQILKYYQLL